MKITIRTYEPRDATAALYLAEAYASWDGTLTLADIQGFHAQNHDLFFVAEIEGKIVGFIYGTESKPPQETLDKWKANKVGSIDMLAVAKEQRRRGIATSLLNKLFETFRQKGVDMVTLSVPAQETGALRLYEKLGFEPRGYFLRKRL